MKLVKSIAAAIFLPSIGLAGIPVSEKITCPIGGEVFEITNTLSCSTYPERTMSFAPMTSCDFVTHLPQCPNNFLPLYKDFSEEDIVLLRDYMLTESYDSSVDGSRYFLAYIIEKYIGNDPTLAFNLLLQGMWHDSVNAFPDPIYLDSFLYEAVGELARAPVEQQPYLNAIIAYVYAKTDQPDQAMTHLEQAKMAQSDDAMLAVYILRIENCIPDPHVEICQPDQLIKTK